MINYSPSIPQLIDPLENKKQINIQFLGAFATLLFVFYQTADHFFVADGKQLEETLILWSMVIEPIY